MHRLLRIIGLEVFLLRKGRGSRVIAAEHILSSLVHPDALHTVHGTSQIQTFCA